MSWTPKDPIKSPVVEMETVDPDKIDVAAVYKLLISAIVPRPIALVSTCNKEGQGNLAPFSFFNGISSNPPTLMISVARKSSGEKKDTLRNILETKEFVVNTSSTWLFEPLVHCGGEFPYGESEFEITGLTPIASHKIKPFRVKEAAIHFECKLSHTVEIGDGSPGSSVAVFGKIIMIHVMKEAYVDGKVIAETISPIARLGGISYSALGEEFKKPIPKV